MLYSLSKRPDIRNTTINIIDPTDAIGPPSPTPVRPRCSTRPKITATGTLRIIADKHIVDHGECGVSGTGEQTIDAEDKRHQQIVKAECPDILHTVFDHFRLIVEEPQDMLKRCLRHNKDAAADAKSTVPILQASLLCPTCRHRYSVHTSLRWRPPSPQPAAPQNC